LPRALRTILAASAAITVTTIVGAGPSAAQEPKQDYCRAIGGNSLAHKQNDPLLAGFGINCTNFSGDGSAPVIGITMTMKVDAKTRAKLGLKSATLGKGDAEKRGEGYSLRLTASKAVRKKLRAAKTVPVTIRMVVTSPVQETVTKKVDLVTRGTIRRLVVATSADPGTAEDGGGRAEGR
jgi:hypothetical protein